jgi:hypothetical protein
MGTNVRLKRVQIVTHKTTWTSAIASAGMAALAALSAIGTSQADCDNPAQYLPEGDANCPAVVNTNPLPDAACLAYRHIPQCLSLLCWAAAGQVVINSFKEQNQDFVAQWQMVQTGRTPHEIGNQYACYQQLPDPPCNNPNDPDNSLTKLDFSFLTLSGSQDHLTWEQVQAEIAERGHPFIFEWAYRDDSSHYLVVTGYYTTTSKKKKLRIWDPLPVGSGSARPINFATYVADGGSNDMGRSVWHEADYYQVHPNLPTPPSDVHVESPPPAVHTASPVSHAVVTPPSPFDVSIDQARKDSGPAALRYLQELQSEQSSAPGGAQALVLGAPFPIIALGLNDLRAKAGHSPATLLRKQTHVVLYPVMVKNEVVDSFLIIRDSTGWSEGGYANTTVTRLLNEYRSAYADKHGMPVSRFYMLSVPALSAFFAATGSGSSTVLIPASDDESIGAKAGVAQSAGQLIPQLIAAAKGHFDAYPRAATNGARPQTP